MLVLDRFVSMYIPESPKPLRNPAPLERIPGLTEQQIESLKAHWIVSIQELVALGEMPSTKRGLANLLGVTETELGALIKLARRQLSQMRGMEDTDDAALDELEYASGALEPAPEMRAKLEYERIPYEAPFPPALSYADELPPIRNQGARGTCVAYAAAAVREFLEIQRLKRLKKKVNPKRIDLSEQFIYWWCKEKDGLPTVSGTYPSLGLQCLLEAGAPTEKTWPYNPTPTPENEGQGPPPKKALEEAKRYRLGKIIHLRPDDIESMKAALLQGKSVMITIPIVASWFRSRMTRKFGKINLPLPEEKVIGAHALALIGYVDDATAPGGGYFILRNAWKPWGMKNPLGPGLGTIPYAFLQEYNTIADVGAPFIEADVYVRDNEEDRGEAPSRGLTFNSPDIWVRHQRDDKEEHQPPRAGEKHWIYVRAWNLGPEKATDVLAEVFVAPASPSIWPDMWQSLGVVELRDIEPGGNVVGSISWTPDEKTPQRLLVRLQSAEDPAQHEWAVRYDNNIAQKNIIHLQMRPGETRTITFPLFGLPGELTLRAVRVDRRDFRGGRLQLRIEQGQNFRGDETGNEDEVLKDLACQATETRTASLTIRINPNATSEDGGAIVIRQKYRKVLVGQMMVRIEIEQAST